jgi:hypothetical protein
MSRPVGLEEMKIDAVRYPQRDNPLRRDGFYREMRPI